jgi:hypothetical protein
MIGDDRRIGRVFAAADAVTIQFDGIEVFPDRTGIEARGVIAAAGVARPRDIAW